jgi:extracellular factor (EF) 3-hydroxypalmitic acid methyl ester biosynthesis protein
MSKILDCNGSGNGSGANGLLPPAKKRTAPPPAAAPGAEAGESWVTFQTRDGLELRGALVRAMRHRVVFEVENPTATLRLSEALPVFQIGLQGQKVYSGRAVVRNLVDAGSKIICEAALDEEQWTDLNLILAVRKEGQVAREFKSFLKDWQKFYKVLPEFKVAVADMQTFLHDLRLWLNQVELRLDPTSKPETARLEKDIGHQIGQSTTPILTEMFEKFEDITQRIDADLSGAHEAFARRMLHPLLLCSPFLHRTYCKPLGYAGDYEMVNMMFRNPLEGESLFAKVVNLWFLKQPPAQAHRNRIDYLIRMLDETAFRARKAGKVPRVLSIGCGPAIEVQQFMARKFFIGPMHFTLLDFDQETLNYTRGILERIKSHCHNDMSVEFVHKSVERILREGNRRATTPGEGYDFVYCAGLFDYLADPICQRLMDIMYEWVNPKGLLVATNVSTSNPRKPTMDYIMDWHLIYRSAHDLSRLKPGHAPADECIVKADDTGVNIFMEAKKSSE